MLSQYYQNLLNHNPPTLKENYKLLHNAINQKTDEAIWKLVYNNIRLVSRILYKHYLTEEVQDDYFSEGVLGFYYAVKRLRKKTTIKQFFRYTQLYIHGYMQDRMKYICRYHKRNVLISTLVYNNLNADETEDDLILLIDPNMNIYEDIMRNEFDTLFNNFIEAINKSDFKLTDKQNLLLRLLYETDNDIMEVRKKLNITRQAISACRFHIRSKIKRFLRCNPKYYMLLYRKVKNENNGNNKNSERNDNSGIIK